MTSASSVDTNACGHGDDCHCFHSRFAEIGISLLQDETRICQRHCTGQRPRQRRRRRSKSGRCFRVDAITTTFAVTVSVFFVLSGSAPSLGVKAEVVSAGRLRLPIWRQLQVGHGGSQNDNSPAAVVSDEESTSEPTSEPTVTVAPSVSCAPSVTPLPSFTPLPTAQAENDARQAQMVMDSVFPSDAPSETPSAAKTQTPTEGTPTPVTTDTPEPSEKTPTPVVEETPVSSEETLVPVVPDTPEPTEETNAPTFFIDTPGPSETKEEFTPFPTGDVFGGNPVDELGNGGTINPDPLQYTVPEECLVCSAPDDIICNEDATVVLGSNNVVSCQNLYETAASREFTADQCSRFKSNNNVEDVCGCAEICTAPPTPASPTPPPTPSPTEGTSEPTSVPDTTPRLTPFPTRETPRPSSRPSPSPTPFPTRATPRPSPRPSPSPTPFPTRATPRPSSRPSPSPTPFPTRATPRPSPRPSPSPTPFPTRIPIGQPVTIDDGGFEPLTFEPGSGLDDDVFEGPTADLTNSPTPIGRQSLTLQPTSDFPSDTPSESPSESPTSSTRPPTRRPTPQPVAPVADPTLPPTPFPTRRPTPRPTTPQPTPRPSPRPTERTPQPTPRPSPSPTLRPTPVPTTPRPTTETPRPTLFTFPPVPGPTPVPTPLPTTESPTAEPSPRPSPSPTSRPSPLPTQPPTDEPTFVPTGFPTVGASQDPTPSGTLEPTEFLSDSPSTVPTITLVPSESPTTVEPSYVPSDVPSALPSLSPTGAPSPAPSSAPSLPLQTDIVPAQMGLFPFGEGVELGTQDIFTWEEVTEDFIRKHILELSVEPPIFDLVVRTKLENQIAGGTIIQGPPANAEDARQTRQKRRQLRELQEDASSEANDGTVTTPSDVLSIILTVSLRYRSESRDQDIAALVGSAWETTLDRANYVIDLQRQSSTFNTVQDVDVRVSGYIPPPPTPAPSTDGGKANIAVIVGASVGGAALLVLVILLFMTMRRRSKGSFKAQETEESKATPSSQQNVKVSTEIVVEPQDDVSTLGDPMFGQGGMMMAAGMDKDEVTASVGDNYEYTNQYGRQTRDPLSVGNGSSQRDRMISEDYTKMSSANSIAMSKLGRMGDNLFADDASFEQQFADPEERFDVVAPAGKLGMVIDTPNGGVPVVHAIKDTSVLANQVRVGDRLMSVDAEDCTGMTAMQVSKLISLKSEKPARVLVFARSAANANADDQNGE